ncbi:MAG: hypothetical protein ACPGJV_10150 [Bacteriovoracaceae bacterium]
MSTFSYLKSIWKKLGINGSVKNYSKIDLWVVENDTTGGPVARVLPGGFKTPKGVDFDGFKRVDGKAIQRHKNWWKFYDFTTVEVSTDGRGLRVSAIAKVAVSEKHFNNKKPRYLKGKWGERLTVILDVKRNSKKKTIAYNVSDHGWLDFETTFKMVCHHEIDNARPVFPQRGNPYIRSKRDKSILNNFSKRGRG